MRLRLWIYGGLVWAGLLAWFAYQLAQAAAAAARGSW